MELKKYPHVKQVRLLTHDGRREQVLSGSQCGELTGLIETQSIPLRIAIYDNSNIRGADLGYESDPLRELRLSPDSSGDALQLANACGRQILRKTIDDARATEVVSRVSLDPVAVPAKEEDYEIPEEYNQIPRWKSDNFDIQSGLKLEVAHSSEQTVAVQQAVNAEQMIAAEANANFAGDKDNLLDIDKYVSLLSLGSAGLGPRGYDKWHEMYDSFIPHNKSDYYNELQKMYKMFWKRVTGDQIGLSHSFRYMTYEAMDKIHESVHFLGGMHIDNLPEGFYAQWYEDSNPNKSGYILDYNPTRLIERTVLTPLTPVLKHKPKWEKWYGDERQFFPYRENTTMDQESAFKRSVALRTDERWKDTGEPYFPVCRQSLWDNQQRTVCKVDDPIFIKNQRNKMENDLKKWMRSLNSDIAEKIIQQHAWFINENTTRREIFALIDILYHQGCEGILKFLDILKNIYDANKPLMNHIRDYYISAHAVDNKFEDERKYAPIMPLMSGQNLKILQELPSFSPNYQRWLMKISECFFSVTHYLELDVIHNGLTYFVMELKKLVSDEDIDLPEVCPLKEGFHPFVQMDRLLFILKQVSPENRKEQLKHLSCFNLSAEGDWYASKWYGFKFIHPVMQLSPEPGKKLLVTWDDLKKLKTFDNDAKVAFHRYIGLSSDIKTPYQYYIDVVALVEKRISNAQTKLCLLKLLAVILTHIDFPSLDDIQKFLSTLESNNTQLQLLFAKVIHKINPTQKITLIDLQVAITIVKEAGEANVIEWLCASSETPFKSLEVWNNNQRHLNAKDFVAFAKSLKEANLGELNFCVGMLAVVDNTGFKPESRLFPK